MSNAERERVGHLPYNDREQLGSKGVVFATDGDRMFVEIPEVLYRKVGKDSLVKYIFQRAYDGSRPAWYQVFGNMLKIELPSFTNKEQIDLLVQEIENA